MGTHDIGTLIAVGCAGLVSGLVSFSALWWGLRRTVERERHAIWVVAGMLARLGLLAAVFWLASRGDAVRLAAALAGFLVAQAMALGFGFGARTTGAGSAGGRAPGGGILGGRTPGRRALGRLIMGGRRKAGR